MPVLTINGLVVDAAEGATVLDAAASVSIAIPTLCHAMGYEPETSCMLCVVKDLKTGQLIPACAARAAQGMKIDTDCEEVRAARCDVLNLLLSEHVGDCEAPCTRICPAHLDIPRMLREIRRGRRLRSEVYELHIMGLAHLDFTLRPRAMAWIREDARRAGVAGDYG